MPKCERATLFFLSGFLWLIAGFNLLPLGLRLLVGTLDPEGSASSPLLDWLRPYFSQPEQAVQALILFSLFIGFLKGRMILGKTVAREVTRINTLPSPAPLSHLYGKKTVILILLMMGLGFSMRWMSIPPDIRGVIDVAVGAALINGAVLYFKQAWLVRSKNQTPVQL